VESLVKKICDYKQYFTHFAGGRPFGTALLMAGVDEAGPRLYETDPSGALVGYKAASIGAGRAAVMEVFEEKYKEDMDSKQALLLGIQALQQATEDPLSDAAVEIGVVTESEAFKKLSSSEVKKIIDEVKDK